MWPPRKNRVPCSSGVTGPWLLRWYPLKCSKTLNSMGSLLRCAAASARSSRSFGRLWLHLRSWFVFGGHTTNAVGGPCQAWATAGTGTTSPAAIVALGTDGVLRGGAAGLHLA